MNISINDDNKLMIQIQFQIQSCVLSNAMKIEVC